MRREPGLGGRFLPAALVACAVAAVFGRAIWFPFLDWDDRVNIADNPFLAFDAKGIWWMLTGSLLGHWHPAAWLSLALDRLLWGPGPAASHATNVFLHALNAVLLMFAGRRLLAGSPAKSDLAAASGPAMFAALLWALHPLRVESVAWVSERRDVLSGCLALGCLLAHLAACDEPAGRRRRRWAWAAVALGSLAMTAKVFCVVLPAALLAADWRLGRGLRWREKLPYGVMAAVSLGMNLRAQAESGASVPLAAFGAASRLAQSGHALSFPILKTAWPSGLAPLHERSPLLEPQVFAAGALAAALLAAAVWLLRRREPGLLQASAAYLILSAPVLGLFKSGRMTAAERWTYLPAIPLTLVIAAAARRLPSRARAPVAAAVLAAAAFATISYLPVWSSDEAVWERACEASPLSYFARLKLASARAAAGKTELAEEERREAAALHKAVFERAAAVYAARGDSKAAEEARRRAAEVPMSRR